MAIELDENDGFVEVVKGEHRVRLDIWRAHNAFYEVHTANKDKPGTEYGEALVREADAMGFPGLSHGAAQRLWDALADLVRDAKKKPVTNAESPASTASTPAP